MLFDYLPKSIDCKSQGVTNVQDQSRFYFGGLGNSFDCQGPLANCAFFANRSANAIEAQRFYYASILNSSNNVQNDDPQGVFKALETVIQQKAALNLDDSTNYFTYQIILVTDYVLDVLLKKSFYLEQQTEDNDIHLFAFLHNLNQSLYSSYLPSTIWSVNKNFGSASNQNTFLPICVQIMPGKVIHVWAVFSLIHLVGSKTEEVGISSVTGSGKKTIFSLSNIFSGVRKASGISNRLAIYVSFLIQGSFRARR